MTESLLSALENGRAECPGKKGVSRFFSVVEVQGFASGYAEVVAMMELMAPRVGPRDEAATYTERSVSNSSCSFYSEKNFISFFRFHLLFGPKVLKSGVHGKKNRTVGSRPGLQREQSSRGQPPRSSIKEIKDDCSI